MSYIIHTNGQWDPNEEQNRHRVNVCLWQDQLYPDGGTVMPSCPIFKQRYISIEDGKFLFCKSCGQRINIEQQKQKKEIQSKGGKAQGTSTTVLKSQPNMRRKKPMSKEEEMERNYFHNMYNVQENFEVGW